MNKQTMKKFEERFSPLRERIDHLERLSEVRGVEAVACYSKEEDDLLRQIHALAILAAQAGEAFSRTFGKRLESLLERLKLLPSIPRIESIKLAQTILALQPLILVTDDTIDEERQKAVLTRIFLMEPTKVSCFDYQFPTLLYDNTELSSIDEVGSAEKTEPLSASLDEAWAKLQKVVHGRYVVAFDAPLVQLQLAVIAQQNGLPVPILVGHSLLDLLLKYARVKEVIGEESNKDTFLLSDSQLYSVLALEDVAPFVSDSIPAEQRAHHLLQALEAMADGTFPMQEPLPVSSLLPLAVSM
jgi:hypothetical protein